MVERTKKIQSIVNAVDPMGLLTMGAPENEHIMEIVYIEEKMDTWKSKRDFEENMINHFKDQFDTLTFFQERALKKVSRELWSNFGKK